MLRWLKTRDDLDLLQCLIFGEARGENIVGQIGVAWVVRNRVEQPVTWWGKTYQDVMLKPKQFSCFNADDPNLAKIRKEWVLHMYDPTWKQARWVAGGVLYRWLPDITKGANHYHTMSIKPKWADDSKITAKIDRHVFYRL